MKSMEFAITCFDPRIPAVRFIDVDPSDNKLATKKMLEKGGKTFLPIISDVINADGELYIYVVFKSHKWRSDLSPIKSYKPKDFAAKLDDYLHSFFRDEMPKF